MTDANTNSAPVLVGIDGSTGSQAAVALGAWEAARRGAPLQLVHGYLDDVGLNAYGWIPGAPATVLRATADEMLDQALARVRAANPHLAVHATLVGGTGGASLVELSQGASLVVVGSRGAGGFASLLVGSVATQVSLHAHAPVIVVRPPAGPGEPAATAARIPPHAGPVMVGVDGSGFSADALAFAADEASARRCELIVTTVWSMPPYVVEHGANWQQFDLDAARARAEDILSVAVAGWREKYPELEVLTRAVEHPNPADALAQASSDASLLVVGHRGRGGFASLLLGSVGRALVGHALCPVAIVR